MTAAEIKREVLTVTQFERLTKSPEVLGAFLAGLPILEGPWDEEFQRRYCSGCGKVSCDDGSRCPYEDKRSNPGWWLKLEAEPTAAGICPGGCLLNYADPEVHCDGCRFKADGGSGTE